MSKTNEIKKQHYTGERALFKENNAEISNCLFDDGESPLKESSNLIIKNTTFGWKYPLWYGNNFDVSHCTFKKMARAGIWYTNNSNFKNCLFRSPKMFRRCKNILVSDTNFTLAEETFWACSDIVLKNVKAKGNYLGMNSKNLKIENLDLIGNYAFDGGRNIEIIKSKMITKDAFWNCENVTITDSYIEGEYFGWNSKNITLINCTIKSHQGFCYMDNIKLINCQVIDTDLSFEYCSNIDADIKTVVDSIKNPISGTIKVKGVKELIKDDKKIDFTKTKILVLDKDNYHEI